jgi:hypothetical protein
MRGYPVFRVLTDVTGGKKGPVSHLLGEGKPKLPSPLYAVRNPSVESSIIAHRGVGAPLRVQLMKVALALPLLGERLRPPK